MSKYELRGMEIRRMVGDDPRGEPFCMLHESATDAEISALLDGLNIGRPADGYIGPTDIRYLDQPVLIRQHPEGEATIGIWIGQPR